MLSSIDVIKVSKVILEIMQEFIDMDYSTIAVDGKVICSTHGNNAKEKLHILTVYVVENGLCLS